MLSFWPCTCTEFHPSFLMDEAAAWVRCKATRYWLTQSQIYGSPQNQSALSISWELDWSLECVAGKCMSSKIAATVFRQRTSSQEDIIYLHLRGHDLSWIFFVVCLFIVLSFSIFSTSKILYLSLTSSFYTNFCAYLNSPFHAVFFFVQVIRQGRVEIQVCPLTGAGRRVIFGSAARCISAVLRATCSLAPPRGCAYPMAPGLERSLPANVSRLQSWVYDLQAPLLYFSHYIFTVFKTRTWTQFSDTLGVIFISLI